MRERERGKERYGGLRRYMGKREKCGRRGEGRCRGKRDRGEVDSGRKRKEGGHVKVRNEQESLVLAHKNSTQ